MVTPALERLRRPRGRCSAGRPVGQSASQTVNQLASPRTNELSGAPQAGQTASQPSELTDCWSGAAERAYMHTCIATLFNCHISS